MEYSKNELRKFLIKQRSEITDKKIIDDAIINKLISQTQRFSKIFVYINYGSEIETITFIEEMLKKNKEIYVPVCHIDDCTMEASRITSMENLVKNAYGILEPRRIIDSNAAIEAVVFPGVAFDTTGNRIGYGKGYYDKYISGLTHEPFKIGICYDFQLLNKIPSEIHDVKMDMIITEDRTVSV